MCDKELFVWQVMATENMRKKLTEVGVDLNSSESEQITHLWNLYIKTQVSVLYDDTQM